MAELRKSENFSGLYWLDRFYKLHICDRRAPHDYIGRAYAQHRAEKKEFGWICGLTGLCITCRWFVDNIKQPDSLRSIAGFVAVILRFITVDVDRTASYIRPLISPVIIARQHTDARHRYSKSVCLSVTFRYQMETASHIVIVFFDLTVTQSL